MNRHNTALNGYPGYKRDDDASAHPRRDSDIERKNLWNLHDLVEDDPSFSKFQPRHPRRDTRERQWRIAKKIAVLLAGVVAIFYIFRQLLGLGTVLDYPGKLYEIETVRYYDLEDMQGSPMGWKKEERVLLCTPLRDASAHLSMFFGHLRNFTYPHHLVDLAFLVSDSKDDTEAALDAQLELLQNDPTPGMPFGEISIIHKDFGQAVSQDAESRHGFAVQASRRKLMAQARNWLLSAALRPYHSWVYWRDADVETCPFTIIEDLMRHDKDVIVPNVWRPLPEWLGGEQPYDLNSWQESETAIALAETLDEDAVIVEGYAEYATWRPHLAYLRDPYGDPDVEMELDGVGGVSILAKARVFRAGVHFPAFSFERHAETEGFGKMARRMQFSVVGLPHYTIWHLYEPSVDDIRHMEEMEKEKKQREKEEKEKADMAKKVKAEFSDPTDQWANDQAALKQNENVAKDKSTPAQEEKNKAPQQQQQQKPQKAVVKEKTDDDKPDTGSDRREAAEEKAKAAMNDDSSEEVEQPLQKAPKAKAKAASKPKPKPAQHQAEDEQDTR